MNFYQTKPFLLQVVSRESTALEINGCVNQLQRHNATSTLRMHEENAYRQGEQGLSLKAATS